MSVYWIKRIYLIVAQCLKLQLPSLFDCLFQLVIYDNMLIFILLISFQLFTLLFEPLWIDGLGLIIKGVPSKLGINSYNAFLWIFCQLFERYLGTILSYQFVRISNIIKFRVRHKSFSNTYMCVQKFPR